VRMEIVFCCQRGLVKVEKILVYGGYSNKLRETKICRTILLLLHSYVTVHILINLNSHTPAFHSHIFSIFQSKLPILRLDSLLSLGLRLLRRSLQIRLQLLALELHLALGVLQRLIVQVDPGDLCGSDGEDERVHTGEGHVLRSDDEAPARPDGACAHKGEVLSEGELGGGSAEVGGAGEDHAPFHYGGPGAVSIIAGLGIGYRRYGSPGKDAALRPNNKICVPEVYGLGTDRAVHEASKARLRAGSRTRSSAGIGLEVLAEGAEDAGAGAERHICSVVVLAIPMDGVSRGEKVSSAWSRTSCVRDIARCQSSRRFWDWGLRLDRG
jgi:hypothetical protein